MVPNGGGTEGKVDIGWKDREIQREEEIEKAVRKRCRHAVYARERLSTTYNR